MCVCRQSLLLEEQGIISLWYHNLPSLEEAVLRLLESVLANNESSPQKLEQLLEQALLVGHFDRNTTSNVQRPSRVHYLSIYSSTLLRSVTSVLHASRLSL